MSTGCERGKNDMQPSYQSCDTSNNNNMNGILNKSHVSGLGEAHSSLLSEIHAPFLSISPMLAFTNSYIDLPVDSACNQLEVLDSVGSPLQYGLNEDLYLDQCSPITGWNRCLDLGLDTDQNLEDVFTASKECLGDGPTLAALNASDKSVLDDLELEELSLPEEISSQIRSSGIPTPTQDSQDSLSIQLVCNVTAPNVELPVARSQSAAVRQETPTEIPKHSTLHDLLVQNRTPSPVTLQNQQPGSRLDIKVEPVSPAESYYEHHHQLQPEQPSYGRPTAITALNSDSFADQTVVDGGNSAVSEFVESIKSEVTDNESHDEGFDSELDESDHCNDECSDVESLSSLDLSRNSNSPVTLSKARKKERYFWQYNLQAKGPKGNRMPLSSEALDPHMLDEITDPVFSPTST